jgi:Domain of unknown function (DUF4388)
VNNFTLASGERRPKAHNTESLLGRLRHGSVPAILHYLSAVSASGELLLLSGVHRAVIALNLGFVVDARFDTFDGERALYRAMQLEVGCFALDESRHSKVATVDGSLQGLLMQAAYWQDTERALERVAANSVLTRCGPPFHAGHLSDIQRLVLDALEDYPEPASIAHRLGMPVEVIIEEVAKLVAAGILTASDPGRKVNPRFIKEMRDHLGSMIGQQAQVAFGRAVREVGHSENLDELHLAEFLDELGRDISIAQQIAFLSHARRIAPGYGLV